MCNRVCVRMPLSIPLLALCAHNDCLSINLPIRSFWPPAKRTQYTHTFPSQVCTWYLASHSILFYSLHYFLHLFPFSCYIFNRLESWQTNTCPRCVCVCVCASCHSQAVCVRESAWVPEWVCVCVCMFAYTLHFSFWHCFLCCALKAANKGGVSGGILLWIDHPTPHGMFVYSMSAFHWTWYWKFEWVLCCCCNRRP